MSRPTNVTINGLLFRLTCSACPEQYDVRDSTGKQVGYVRLRHGQFTVDYPDCLEDELMCENFDEDEGCFESDQRRAYWLGRAADAIRERLKKEGNETK